MRRPPYGSWFWGLLDVGQGSEILTHSHIWFCLIFIYNHLINMLPLDGFGFWGDSMNGFCWFSVTSMTQQPRMDFLSTSLLVPVRTPGSKWSTLARLGFSWTWIMLLSSCNHSEKPILYYMETPCSEKQESYGSWHLQEIIEHHGSVCFLTFYLKLLYQILEFFPDQNPLALQVVLVGGSTRIPVVQRLARERADGKLIALDFFCFFFLFHFLSRFRQIWYFSVWWCPKQGIVGF